MMQQEELAVGQAFEYDPEDFNRSDGFEAPFDEVSFPSSKAKQHVPVHFMCIQMCRVSASSKPAHACGALCRYEKFLHPMKV